MTILKPSHSKSIAWRAAGVAALLMLAAHAQAAGYTFTTVTVPGSGFNDVWDINNSGQMVGSWYDSNNSHGYVFSGGMFTTLNGPVGAIGSNALGISDTGIVVGSYYTSTSVDPSTGAVVPGPSSGYIYDGSGYTTFNAPGSVFTQLRGVSPDGRYVTGIDDPGTGNITGFVYDRGTSAFTPIPSSSDSITLIAQGVNNAGMVVGSDLIFDGFQLDRPGFIYDSSTGTRTDYHLANRTSFRAIDESGRLAGFLGTVSFIGSPGSFETLGFPGATQTLVEGMNNAGALVGVYFDANFNEFGFLANPVPEPETYAMMLAGLGLLGFAARRRKRNAAA